MADEVALQEEEELEALLGFMSDVESYPNSQTMEPEEDMNALLYKMNGARNTGNQFPTTPTPQDQPPLDTPYGSDDEDYDDIFREVIQEESRISNQQESSVYLEADHEMMDMS
jgi:hypothetical protein